MEPPFMHLKVLLPFQIFLERQEVTRIVAEAHNGSFGLLPRRLDCVAAIPPGIITYETAAEGEVYLAVDEGVLVKTGRSVLVSVRHAMKGTDPGDLRKLVEQEFLTIDEHEHHVRAVMAKLEIGFFRRLAAFQHE